MRRKRFMDLTDPAPLPSVPRRRTHYGRQLEITRWRSRSGPRRFQGPAQKRNGPDQLAAQARCQGNRAPTVAAQGSRWPGGTGSGGSAQARRSGCTRASEARYPPARSGRSPLPRRSCWCRTNRPPLPAAEAFCGEGDRSPFPPAQAHPRRASRRGQASPGGWQGDQAARPAGGGDGRHCPDSRIHRGGDGHNGFVSGPGRRAETRWLKRRPSRQQASCFGWPGSRQNVRDRHADAAGFHRLRDGAPG